MVERSNALEPDLIVITGDIFDFDPAFIEDGLRRLAELRARCGVYAILGNHDIYTGTQRVVAGFAAFAPGIRLLRDEIVKLPLPEPLYLAGVEDPGPDWSARGLELPAIERLAGERAADGPTLLLVHRPEAFPQAARLGLSARARRPHPRRPARAADARRALEPGAHRHALHARALPARRLDALRDPRHRRRRALPCA